MPVYLDGLLLGLSLIVALGPQNLFLIKQGARKNHALLSAGICFICDFILMSASITGLHQLLLTHHMFQIGMMLLGCLFLAYYAIKALKNAILKSIPTTAIFDETYSRTQIIILALGFSLLNPHAIIDTLVIIGGGSSEYPEQEFTFLLGVITSSLIWFSSLIFTAIYFSHILTKATIWKGIELFSGILMLSIAIKLGADGIQLLLSLN